MLQCYRFRLVLNSVPLNAGFICVLSLALHVLKLCKVFIIVAQVKDPFKTFLVQSEDKVPDQRVKLCSIVDEYGTPVEIRPGKYRNDDILIGMKDEHPRSISHQDNKHSSKSKDYYFPIRGILFFKMTKNPWGVQYSATQKRFYYYQKGKESVFEPPNDINPSPIDCYSTRRLWPWEIGVGIKNESPKEGTVHMSQLLNFIAESKKH